MYFWKCWRDTRSFLLVFVLVGAAAMPVTALISTGTGLMRDFSSVTAVSTFGFLMTGVALALGTIAAIHQFSGRAIHFLFTKPRSRAYFLWCAWMLGCAELLAIAFAYLASAVITVALYKSGSLGANLLASLSQFDVVKITIYGIFLLGLTFSLTAIFGDGLKGLGASLMTMTSIWWLAAGLRARWNLDLAVPAQRIGHLPMTVSYVIWILLTLSFIFAAQLALERADI